MNRIPEFVKVIETQKQEVRLEIDIEELEQKIAPDGGELSCRFE